MVTRIDHIRPPYGRRTEDIPRSCVFAATTNSGTSLGDETGNRRFWPVECGTINVDALAADRDQLWAEAYHQYRTGAKWWLDTAELEQLATQEQDERYCAGVWDQVIQEWTNSPTQRSQRDGEHGEMLPIEPFDSTRDEVTISDILIHAIGKPLGHWTQTDMNQVAKTLVHQKWKRGQKGTGVQRKRVYRRLFAG